MALADGERVRAGVLAEHRPVLSRIGPGRRPRPAWRSRNASWRVPARKQRSWESRLARDRQAGLGASSRTSCLRISPSGKRSRASEPGASAPARSSDPCGRRRCAAARAAALLLARARARNGRWRASAQPSRSASSIIASSRTLPLQRTHGLGVSPAAWSASQPSTTPGAELGAQVDREMRHPELVRELAGAAHGLGRAAAELAVVLGVRPQLEGHPDRLVAARRDQQRGDRAVDAATHRDQRALGSGGKRRAPARRRRARGAARRRPARRRGAWPALRPPSSPAISRRPASRVQQRAPAQQADAALPAATVGAAAARVEPRVLDRARGSARSIAIETRIRSPQAAPPAAPVKASGGQWPRPAAVRDG